MRKTLAAGRYWYRHPGAAEFRSAPAMEYLYGLLFGPAPEQSDADASHSLRTKLEALPGDRDAQITLTAAELRIL